MNDHEPLLQEIAAHWTQPFSFRDSCVALLEIGSHSHGTHIPPEDPNGIDDRDVLAVVIPPPQYVYGLHRFQHAEIKQGSLDCVVYSYDKYINLLLKSNPNVLGTLWMDWGRQYKIQVPWTALSDSRRIFSSKLAYPAFIGYAKSQLHRMTHNACAGYMGAKRKALVEKFGYDVKNAAHLIRLLRMAVGFLEHEVVEVDRSGLDAGMLKDIKSGAWSLEMVQEEAAFQFAEAERWLARTYLPERPDTQEAERIMMDSYQQWWNLKGCTCSDS